MGMDLELQQTEASVGGYALDILATDRNQNRPVVIENQLEATNHTHLGQLLTYAAGFNAGVIVWVTKEFRDEHRQTLDWLNERTGDGTQFFGIVVELWRIGNSLPAPHFNIVATPNEWRKETVKGGGEAPAVSERRERYRQFFQSLIDTLREKGFTNARKGQPQSWYSFGTGYGNISYGAVFTGNKQARVEVYFGGADAERNTRLLDGLEQYKRDIESQLEKSLDWQHLEHALACRIALDRPGSIDDDDETLSTIQSWMVDHLLSFKEVFGPRLAELVG